MTATHEAPLREARRAPRTIHAVLYGLRGKPPSMAAQLMLEHKGIPFRRIDMLDGRHEKTLARRGFPGTTAPALELDGELIQTNRDIARALDAVVPEPPLLPRDAVARDRVEEAEEFCNERFQPSVRRIALSTLRSDRHAVDFHPRLGSLLPWWLPPFLTRRAMDRTLPHYGGTEAVIGHDFRSLPGMLDRLDSWVEDGVLNGPELNAADFQIGPLVAFLMGVRDVGPGVAQRPVAALAERVLPRVAPR
jgi:glutathione S-transferase